MALLGIGLVAMPTGIISAGFLEKVNEKKEKKLKEDEKIKKDEETSTQNKKNDENGDNDTKHFCPYCGHRID